MTSLLCTQVKVKQYAWNRTLIGSEGRPGGFLDGKKFLILSGTDPYLSIRQSINNNNNNNNNNNTVAS